MSKCRGGVMAILAILMVFNVFAEDGSIISNDAVAESLPGPIGSDAAENPHSKALGQRIAGGVVMGLGAVNLGVGLICKATQLYENLYAESGMRELGATLDNIMWIPGAVMLGIGIPLFIVGQVKHGQWQKWEREHGRRAGVSLRGNSLVIEF